LTLQESDAANAQVAIRRITQAERHQVDRGFDLRDLLRGWRKAKVD